LFGVLFYFFGASQAISNVIAFCIAVTFSFLTPDGRSNQRPPQVAICVLVFMGVMAALTGFIADIIGSPPVVTLIVFSGFSLVAGFIYSKFIVFRDAK
jgi:putative flippase GtrA